MQGLVASRPETRPQATPVEAGPPPAGPRPLDPNHRDTRALTCVTRLSNWLTRHSFTICGGIIGSVTQRVITQLCVWCVPWSGCTVGSAQRGHVWGAPTPSVDSMGAGPASRCREGPAIPDRASVCDMHAHVMRDVPTRSTSAQMQAGSPPPC